MPVFFSSLFYSNPSILFHSIPFAWKFQKIQISKKRRKKVIRIKNAEARPIYSVQGLRDGRKIETTRPEVNRIERKKALDTNCIVIFPTLRLENVCYVTLDWRRTCHTHTCTNINMRNTERECRKHVSKKSFSMTVTSIAMNSNLFVAFSCSPQPRQP